MRTASRRAERIFFGRGKSPVRNATEAAIVVAALGTTIYGLHGYAIWRAVLAGVAAALISGAAVLAVGAAAKRWRAR